MSFTLYLEPLGLRPRIAWRDDQSFAGCQSATAPACLGFHVSVWLCQRHPAHCFRTMLQGILAGHRQSASRNVRATRRGKPLAEDWGEELRWLMVTA